MEALRHAIERPDDWYEARKRSVGWPRRHRLFSIGMPWPAAPKLIDIHRAVPGRACCTRRCKRSSKRSWQEHTLRDHPLQRTQKAGCLTYVGAEGLAVAGSIPVAHPASPRTRGASAALARAYGTCTTACFVPVCPAVSVTVRITFLVPFVA